MASQYPASIGSVSALPLATALAIIPTLPRPLLNRLVERAIDHMDEQDGDADLEPNGDELDFNRAEDDFDDYRAGWIVEAGCPISDPPEDEHDREEVWFG